MENKSPYIEINIVRKKIGETNPDEYYLEASTPLRGFNSRGNIRNEQDLYCAINFSLKLHKVRELNSEIYLKSNISHLELIKSKYYKGDYENYFDEVGKTGLRRLEGKLLSEGYNIKQRIKIIG